MSKAANTKPVETEAADAPPQKKSKKKLIIIVAMLLLIGGGVAAYFLMKPSHPENPGKADKANAVAEKVRPDVPSVYAQLGTFTANLAQEEGDRYLQVTIELKITNPDLVGKIKATNPEILHRINMLLQSKRPSELASFDGKQKLAEQIRGQVEYVLGLRKTAPEITDSEATPNADQAAPTKTSGGKSGITDVLFTSFIIQ